MKTRLESGASASFLDLLCCALGGILLLVVMFSTRIKPGDESDQGAFAVVEYLFTGDAFSTAADVEKFLETVDPSLNVIYPRQGAVQYLRTAELDTLSSPDFDFRWITSRKEAKGKSALHVYLVMTNITQELAIQPAISSQPRDTPSVTIYTRKKARPFQLKPSGVNKVVIEAS